MIINIILIIIIITINIIVNSLLSRSEVCMSPLTSVKIQSYRLIQARS